MKRLKLATVRIKFPHCVQVTNVALARQTPKWANAWFLQETIVDLNDGGEIFFSSMKSTFFLKYSIAWVLGGVHKIADCVFFTVF